MSPSKQVRPFLLALCAALLVLVLSVLRLVLKLEGMPVTFAIGFGVAGLVALWFVAAVKRAPTQQERTRFLCWYGALLVTPTLLLVVTSEKLRSNGAGLFILALHLLVYLAAAQFFLAEKRMNAFLAKRT